MKDLIILGGGPAGYTAGERAGRAGMDALLIENRALGGVCLNEGCIPTKTFLYSAKIYENAKHGEPYGVRTTDISLDHAAVLARKNKVVKTLTAGVKAALAKVNVPVITGAGVIKGRNADGSFIMAVNGEEYVSRRLLVATGSVPVLPPIPGLSDSLASGLALTNREILDLTAPPEKLVVIGAGPVGLEMASYFASAGSAVTVIEMLDAVGGPIDRDIAVILQKNLEKKGVKFELSAKAVSIGNEVTYEKDGQTRKTSADKILFSIGRRPFTERLGLENIGLTDVKNGVKTDLFMRAGVPGVYAAGDVTNRTMLAHVAYRQAAAAVNHMTGVSDPVRYDAVPACIYTSPETGAVGETEESARKNGYGVLAATLSMNYSGRYLAETEKGDGIIKLITDKKTRRILGCHIIGPYASEIIVAAGILIEQNATVERAGRTIFPHPTVGEIIREACMIEEVD